MKSAGKLGKLSGRTLLYQPLSTASIRLIWENQKFLGSARFSTLIGLMLQVYPGVSRDSVQGSIRYW